MISYSDQWFADASNLNKPSAPIRQVGKFTPAGAWYDGWETRRHNPEPFDWVIFKLGVSSGKIIGAEIDTAFFNGNHAPAISVDGGVFSNNDEAIYVKDSPKWEENVIPVLECGPSQRHFFLRDEITEKAYTHVRLRMYPDGGIARFRLYGTPIPVFPEDLSTEIDLAHVSNGGVAIAYSDQHFGTVDNLLINGRGVDMSDGWETARSRTPGHVDWVIVKLGARGHIDRVVVDTAHFLGNYPQSITVEGINLDSLDASVSATDSSWKTIVPRIPTQANKEHSYTRQEDNLLTASESEAFTHVKLTIIPDGGVKRFRVFGRRAAN